MSLTLLSPSRISTFVILMLFIIGCQDMARVRSYRAGKHPPPPGYEYRKTESGKLVRDSKGNPLFRRIGAPYFTVLTIDEGFAPTLEEYERYKQLMRDKYQLEKQGKSVEVEQIAVEITQLKKGAKGEVPTAAVLINADVLADPVEFENAIRTLQKVLRETYKDHNLDHLYPKAKEENNDFKFK